MSSEPTPEFRLGIISCVPATRDAAGRLLANHSMGRLLDMLRAMVPGAKLCIPVLSHPLAHMQHPLTFPPEDVVDLPPMPSVISSQRYYFQARSIVRRFARTVDVLFIRVPFQIPTALRHLGVPKLLHVVGNPYNVIAASSDYHGFKKMLALRFAAHSSATLRRMAAEPMTRVASNGAEMWNLLRPRGGKVVVSSCIYDHEMRPRENLALGDPPKLLFVGYLRPEKGIHNLLDAFEQLRASRPMKLTLVGGSDKMVSTAEAEFRERIAKSRYREDITLAGMIDFGEQLFDMYRSHDLYILPSLSEGTPRTLVEARAFGCPVVASRAGGIPSSVEHEKDGLLVEPNNSPGLAMAINRVLTDDPLRRRLIQAGLDGSAQQSLEYFTGQLVDELRILAREFGRLRTPTPVAAE